MRWASALLLWLLSPAVLAAQAAPPADAIPLHDSLTITSEALHEARPINIHLPAGYGTSSARYPVLYMPDGGINEDFPHVVNTVDSLVALGIIRPVIVVGIPNTERRRDLTGPTRLASDSAVATHVGGSAAFRRFISDELMPEIDARYRTTDERSIVGESLAGLFIVETFLREPALFTHYVAFDPSIWWNKGNLADSAAALLAHMDSTPRSVYLASSRDDIDAGTARIGQALGAAHRPALTWRFTPRPDLTHGTIFRAMAPVMLGEALR